PPRDGREDGPQPPGGPRRGPGGGGPGGPGFGGPGGPGGGGPGMRAGGGGRGRGPGGFGPGFGPGGGGFPGGPGGGVPGGPGMGPGPGAGFFQEDPEMSALNQTDFALAQQTEELGDKLRNAKKEQREKIKTEISETVTKH